MTLAAAGISPNSYDAPAQMATGTYTGDSSGTPIAVNLGFSPKVVVLIDMATLTNAKRYEWVMGMASTLSLLATGAADIAEDTNSAIVTDWITFNGQNPGVYPPGTQEPGEGSLVNANPTYYGPYKTKSF